MAQPRELPPISNLTLRLFRRVVRSYFRRHFRAVSVQRAELLAQAAGPLVVYANHSSWWDPMVSVLLAEKLQPVARHYAPMDAAALAKYPILRKLGIFPIDMATARGAAQFLRTSQAILDSGGILWITPQGRFADPREPLSFKPGLGALAARNPGLIFVPLAIEYTFWDERLPETLLRFDDPVRIAADTTTEAATRQLEAALATTMADLQRAAIARDPHAFAPLLTGGRGTGGLYALGRRLRALFTGKPVVLDHTQREDPPQPTQDR
jgi:1-acyl-sn-glycerol-3-phosphate acyltransferase